MKYRTEQQAWGLRMRCGDLIMARNWDGIPWVATTRKEATEKAKERRSLHGPLKVVKIKVKITMEEA